MAKKANVTARTTRAAAPAPAQEAQEYGLTHIERHTLRKFLKLVDSGSIKVLPSKEGDGFFFVDDAGEALGAVSSRVVEAQTNGEEYTPVVSLVVPKEYDIEGIENPTADELQAYEENQFYLLHKAGGAEAIFELTVPAED